MKKEVVPRDDGSGRVTIYYSFADEGGVQTSDREPRPASTAQPSATESDVVTEEETR